MKREIIERILSETEQGYDIMADKFSETRKHFWRDLEFIGDYAKDGDKVLDYGCGNGRILELISGKNIEYTGADVSQKLIDIAKNKYRDKSVHFQKISGSDSLAFTDNYFNAVYSIAVFHHLPSSKLRLEMARELFRVTKPGGYIIITVWNLWQKNYLKNILKNWLDKIFGKSDLDWNDCYVAFKNNQGEIFHRYHHVFTKRELEKLFEKAGFKKEKYGIFNKKNVLFVGKKI